MGSERVNLPPGFLFSPTDEELVLHFLYPKASLLPCHPNIIPDLDLSLSQPFQLNGKALSSGNQFYFFTKYKKKRATESGYWKKIGVTESVVSAAGKKVGIKKYLVFNNGEAPHDTETSWVMQEYHLCSSGSHNTSRINTRGTPKPDASEWVLCRVYEKKRGSEDDDEGGNTELSWMDQMYMSTLDDEEEEITFPN
ncbi:NAC domain-containing protein 104-like [Prosopis cineraria]|uniref:NAC domain-containing protein 104-like n=1 Tax=Prosopis cineraria TaxID=364024 RepID=UPI00240EBDE6|nr:NAC domain-containing protein 104-like [Prosopis cineraria]